MKNKQKIHTVRIVPLKSNRTIVETKNRSILPSTHIDDLPFNWLSTHTSRLSGRVKLVVWA